MSSWVVEGFSACFDRWVERDNPSKQWQLAAAYFGRDLLVGRPREMTDDPDLGPGWGHAHVPGAHGGGYTLVAVLQVDEESRFVQCVDLATLRVPTI